MFFYQIPGPNQKIPLATKVSLVVWILLGLGILSFFAFSFFIIALIAGAVIFMTNLFQKNRNTISNNQQEFPTQHYHSHRKQNDDDIIDI